MFFPHKQTGVQLTYGVDAIQYDPTNKTKPWDFGCLRDQKLHLYKIEGSTIKPKQMATKPCNIKGRGKVLNQLHNDIYIPDTIVYNLDSESAVFNSTSRFDPTISGLVASTRFESPDGSVMVAHVSGSSSSVLLVSQIAYENGVLVESSVSKPQIEHSTKLPILTNLTTLDFISPIKQISWARLRDADGQIFPILSVRTVRSVQLLEIYNTKELSFICHFDSSEHFEGDLSDFAFNRKNNKQFSVMDNDGNLKCFELSNSILNEKAGCTIHDPMELSNYKQSLFVDDKSLFIWCRSSLYHYNFKTLTCIVELTSWSKLVFVEYAEGYLFVLTTKELIVVDSMTFERLFSWKHYLRDHDMSLKLHLYTVDGRFMCFLYSGCHSVVEILQLGFTKSTHQFHLLNDPQYITLESSDSVRSLSVLRIPQENNDSNQSYQFTIFIIFYVNQNNEFAFALFSPTPDLKMEDDEESEVVSYLNQSELNSVATKPLLSLSEVNRIYENCLPSFGDVDSVHIIQDYAYALGEFLDSFVRSNNDSRLKCLGKVIPQPNYIDNFEELDSMINQLYFHFENSNLLFDVSNTSMLKPIFGPSFQYSMTSVQHFIKCLWTLPPEASKKVSQPFIQTCNKITQFVGLNMILVRNIGAEDIIPDLSLEAWDDLVSDWDNEYDSSVKTSRQQKSNAKKAFTPVQSQIPTINLSQKQKSKTNSQVSFSQLTQRPYSQSQSQVNSQRPSSQSQQAKKRKKRLGGFA
ncbi:BA75_02477T0 [Komagataella pastoris]|uniref:BA75_02477T0 n=1 Tax=Komagataella pastoris TaxID=4922 RepID=A0A1B2JDK8_PICPA|nr:BA75_02477T0 [Komagataella pastoris]